MSPMLQMEPVAVARKKTVPTVQVRVGKDVAELAAIVAAYRRTQSSDLLTEILRPILQQMHQQEISRLPSGPGSSPPRPAPKKGGKS
jgi:hypothetical protein